MTTANRALVVAPDDPRAIRLADAPEPTPGPGEAVVEVHRASLNRGDLNDARSGRLASGAVLGSDVAGVVLAPAADGSGPPAGTRVVGLADGAFARRVAIPAADLAALPAGVELEAAAALPVAGLAALRSLRAAGSLLARRVLVTGASGGVGTFAIQLAAGAGAHVIASVGSAGREAGLTALGADEVVVGLAGIDRPVDVVIDSVGGPQLVDAWRLLAEGGSIQSVGWASGEPAVFPPYSTIGPPRSLTAYLTSRPVGDDLATLVGLLAEGALRVTIDARAALEQWADAVDALQGRRVRGKAILEVGGPLEVLLASE